MISLSICRKCAHSAWFPHRENSDGEIEVGPAVSCEIHHFGTELLTMSSDVPDECPFSLEHLVLTQDADPEMAVALSVGRVRPCESPSSSAKRERRS